MTCKSCILRVHDTTRHFAVDLASVASQLPDQSVQNDVVQEPAGPLTPDLLERLTPSDERSIMAATGLIGERMRNALREEYTEG